MNNSLRQHLETTTQLPQDVIDEVVSMFNNEAIVILDTLSELKASVRDIVLESLRSYHSALDTNNNTFIATGARYDNAANDPNFGFQIQEAA